MCTRPEGNTKAKEGGNIWTGASPPRETAHGLQRCETTTGDSKAGVGGTAQGRIRCRSQWIVHLRHRERCHTQRAEAPRRPIHAQGWPPGHGPVLERADGWRQCHQRRNPESLACLCGSVGRINNQRLSFEACSLKDARRDCLSTSASKKAVNCTTTTQGPEGRLVQTDPSNPIRAQPPPSSDARTT